MKTRDAPGEETDDKANTTYGDMALLLKHRQLDAIISGLTPSCTNCGGSERGQHAPWRQQRTPTYQTRLTPRRAVSLDKPPGVQRSHRHAHGIGPHQRGIPHAE